MTLRGSVSSIYEVIRLRPMFLLQSVAARMKSKLSALKRVSLFTRNGLAPFTGTKCYPKCIKRRRCGAAERACGGWMAGKEFYQTLSS